MKWNLGLLNGGHKGSYSRAPQKRSCRESESSGVTCQIALTAQAIQLWFQGAQEEVSGAGGRVGGRGKKKVKETKSKGALCREGSSLLSIRSAMADFCR